MNCNKCGAENPDDANFCSKCGLELPLTVTSSTLENQIINNCHAGNKNRKGIKVALTVVAAIVMIFIGLYGSLKGVHEKICEIHKLSIDDEMFNNGGTKISDIVDNFKDSNSLEENLDNDSNTELTEDQQYIKKCYINLWYFNKEYLSDYKLTNSEKDVLIFTLDTLIQALKDEQINSSLTIYSALPDSGHYDTLNEFDKIFFESLDSSYDVITSHWDKISKDETITTEDGENFRKEMDYLKDLSIKE